jgi:hypothetical protein
MIMVGSQSGVVERDYCEAPHITSSSAFDDFDGIEVTDLNNSLVRLGRRGLLPWMVYPRY